MIASKRHELMLDFIKKKNLVSVHDIVEEFNISAVTARRDLEYLEDTTNKVIKVRGGAKWKGVEGASKITDADNKDYLYERFRKQSLTNPSGKTAIAKKAASLLNNGESILIDAGSTMYEFAKNINPQLNITVFITAMNIAEVLEPYDNITKVVMGGVFRSKVTTMVSSMMEQLISSIHVDKLFIASSGISLSHGFTCNDILEADVKKKLLKSAKEVYWLVDSTKVGSISSFQISGFNEEHNIIIDSNIHSKDLKELKELMNVIVAH